MTHRAMPLVSQSSHITFLDGCLEQVVEYSVPGTCTCGNPESRVRTDGKGQCETTPTGVGLQLQAADLFLPRLWQHEVTTLCLGLMPAGCTSDCHRRPDAVPAAAVKRTRLLHRFFSAEFKRRGILSFLTHYPVHTSAHISTIFTGD